MINTLFAGFVCPALRVIDPWSKKLSFCPSLKEYRDVILFGCAVFPIAFCMFGNCPVAVVPDVLNASITLLTRIQSATWRDCVPVNGITTRCPFANRLFCWVASPAEFNNIVLVLISDACVIAVAFTLVFVFWALPGWSQVAYTCAAKDPALNVVPFRLGVILTWFVATTSTIQSTICPFKTIFDPLTAVPLCAKLEWLFVETTIKFAFGSANVSPVPLPSTSNVVPEGEVTVAKTRPPEVVNEVSIVSFLWNEIPSAVNVVPLWDPIPFTFSNPVGNTNELRSVSNIFVLLVSHSYQLYWNCQCP